jgi:hypothetical protein
MHKLRRDETERKKERKKEKKRKGRHGYFDIHDCLLLNYVFELWRPMKI